MSGSIAVHTCNEMAEVFPEHAAFLHDLNARLIDLMKPFTDEIITDPAFKGSASIKAVLPAWLPALSQGDLDMICSPRLGLS